MLGAGTLGSSLCVDRSRLDVMRMAASSSAAQICTIVETLNSRMPPAFSADRTLDLQRRGKSPIRRSAISVGSACAGKLDPRAIVEFIKSKAAGAARVGLETGPTSTWLWTEMKALGLPVICIDARHAKAVLKMQINKSDRNDAFGIARIMQCGWYKEVRVKGLDSHATRALLESRALLVKVKRDLENQIHGLLKHLSLIIGTARGQAFHARVQELEGRPYLAVAVLPLLETRNGIVQQIADSRPQSLDAGAQ